uniref:Uncharacterized protein n=1 Tax=Tolypothrix bouteillei VB521301 TaxID=1479485 RepID=A0A0C1R3S3_9CYAN
MKPVLIAYSTGIGWHRIACGLHIGDTQKGSTGYSKGRSQFGKNTFAIEIGFIQTKRLKSRLYKQSPPTWTFYQVRAGREASRVGGFPAL